MTQLLDRQRAEILRPALDRLDTRALLKMNDALQRDWALLRDQWAGFHAQHQLADILHTLDEHGPTYLLSQTEEPAPTPHDPRQTLIEVVAFITSVEDLLADWRIELVSRPYGKLNITEVSQAASIEPEQVNHARLRIARDLLDRSIQRLRDTTHERSPDYSDADVWDIDDSIRNIIAADLHPASRPRTVRLLTRLASLAEAIDLDTSDDSSPWDEIEESREWIIDGLLLADSLLSRIEADPPPSGASSMRQTWNSHWHTAKTTSSTT